MVRILLSQAEILILQEGRFNYIAMSSLWLLVTEFQVVSHLAGA